jgi:hypothetical protein
MKHITTLNPTSQMAAQEAIATIIVEMALMLIPVVVIKQLLANLKMATRSA